MPILRYLKALPSSAPASILIAADRRLVAAAQSEGLQTVNPEFLAAADVPTLVAAL